MIACKKGFYAVPAKLGGTQNNIFGCCPKNSVAVTFYTNSSFVNNSDNFTKGTQHKPICCPILKFEINGIKINLIPSNYDSFSKDGGLENIDGCVYDLQDEVYNKYYQIRNAYTYEQFVEVISKRLAISKNEGLNKINASDSPTWKIEKETKAVLFLFDKDNKRIGNLKDDNELKVFNYIHKAADAIQPLNQPEDKPMTYCDEKLFDCVYTQNNITTPTFYYKNFKSQGECIRCFKAGEPIGIKNNKLIICKKGSENEQVGNFLEQDLINNSISDTLAYLRAKASLAGDNSDLFQRCRSQGGIFIFLGCIDTTPIGVITGLIRIALGTFGGLALLQMIQIGVIYQLGESEGNKKRIEEARKRLISIFTGILILVFSTLIFRIIGVNILDILPSGSI